MMFTDQTNFRNKQSDLQGQFITYVNFKIKFDKTQVPDSKKISKLYQTVAG